jgi:hypothetical protein
MANQARRDEAEALNPNTRCIQGRALYKGKAYWLLFDAVKYEHDEELHYGKLAFKDGSVTFWTRDGEEFEVVQRYPEKRSLSELKDYAQGRSSRPAPAARGARQAPRPTSPRNAVQRSATLRDGAMPKARACACECHRRACGDCGCNE